ncbi:MAG: SGNH/GDSL hydrolase family protein [Treponema sp.]|nr:SGNH/GDSL hydrolase family protein [Treponema sp.]
MKKFLSIICVVLMTASIFAQTKGVDMNENVRIQKVFSKIRRGEPVTVIALGGSITTGFASNPITTKSWAARTGKWLVELGEKNNSKVTFINQGVSGTDSAFAVARLQDHVLSKKPDLLLLEFAMNDQWLSPAVRQRTYEAILRSVLKDSDAAILALFVNERAAPKYSSNQTEQQALCEYYSVPFVSWKDNMKADDILDYFEKCFDGSETVHPNNAGHEKISEYMIGKLDSIWKTLPEDKEIPEIKELPPAKTDTGFVNAKYYHVDNLKPLLNTGWENGSPVHPEWLAHGQSHKGWQTKNSGAELTFEVEGSSVGITYCESDQFRDAVAWIEKQDGTMTEKTPLQCYSSIRNGYYGWAYKEILTGTEVQKYIVHIQCSKRAPRTAEGKYCNITGILAAGETDK